MPGDPQSAAYFTTSRRRVNDTYGIGLAQNAYQRSLTDSSHSQRLADLSRRFDRQREQIPGAFNRRGLLNSGLYLRGLTEYGTDRATALGGLTNQYQLNLEGLNLAGNQLEGVRKGALDDLALQEEARRAALAATLRALS